MGEEAIGLAVGSTEKRLGRITAPSERRNQLTLVSSRI